MARLPSAALAPAAFVVAVALLAAGCRSEAAANAAAATPTPSADELTVPGHPVAAAPAGPGSSPAAATAAPPFDVAKLPAVVARVDGAEISKAELLQRAAAMRAQMERMGAPPPPQSEEFYRAMADQLIGSRLLFAAAQKRGLVPSDAEVAAQLARLKERDPQGFDRELTAQGVSEQELRVDLAKNLAIQKLVATEVTPAATISADDARRFYQQNPQRMKRPAQVRVRHILVGAGESASAEERQAARKKAEALLVRLEAGEDFAALARESSDDRGSRGEGGLLPWLGPGDTAPAFERAAFALQPGQTSTVVETPFGFHLLQLVEKRAGGSVPFEEAQAQIEQWLSRQRARELLDAKVAALRKAARVDVLF
jgi:peptidyl-prolyl cis-trans isomerase C